MKAHIQKWGNSLALRIPRSFAEETHITNNSVVELTIEQGNLLIKPLRPLYTLEQLLEGVNEENLHGEADFGSPAGNEVW